MKKLKIPLLILLTIMLLIAGAALPTIVAAVQDSATVNKSGYSDIQSVELVFSDSNNAGSLLGKLALIRDGTSYMVSPSETVISLGQIEQIVEECLAPYYQAELIPYNWKNYELSAVPCLIYSSLDYGIFWTVTLTMEDCAHVVDMYIDDETGLPLDIHYKSSTPLEQYTAWGYLDAISNAYFESNGISKILAEPEDFGVSAVFLDNSGLRARDDKFLVYTLTTQTYGELQFHFYLYEQGFYVMLQ